jgi:hypothetical protein
MRTCADGARPRRIPAPPACLPPAAQGPSALVSKRTKPSPADIKTGPAGVPFLGMETIRVDKGLSKALHHKTVTEVGQALAGHLSVDGLASTALARLCIPETLLV